MAGEDRSGKKTRGRMINRDISDSKGFSKLRPPAAVLFCMMIPHYTPWGKMNGDPGYVKGEVCPRVSYLTAKNIPEYLKEISDHTSVKWFEHDGRHWIHSTNFLSDHQNINLDRVGPDQLPSYSGSTPDLIRLEVEVEVKDKEEEEGEQNGLCPSRMVELWNGAIAFFASEGLNVKIPPIRKLTPAREKKCKARIADCELDEAAWKKILNIIHNDDWLSGQKPSPKYPDWAADFNYVVKTPDNIIKILEKETSQ